LRSLEVGFGEVDVVVAVDEVLILHNASLPFFWEATLVGLPPSLGLVGALSSCLLALVLGLGEIASLVDVEVLHVFVQASHYLN
jgi:hypothetical protein